MYNPFPMEYSKINFIEGHYNPSSVKWLNNMTFDFWCRALFQRACSVLEFDLPEEWGGSVKDFFYWVLFRSGHMAVFEDAEFGYLFQPCSLSGYNVFYQPTKAIISNPKIPQLDRSELEIGKRAQIIKLTPDYSGIWDIISYYSEAIANVKSAFDMATINAKIAFILGSKTRAGGEALKKIIDNVNKGNVACVYDMRIANDQTDKDTPFQFLELPSDKAVAALAPLVEATENLLREFDAEIGIPTIPYQKKERMVTSEAESKMTDSTSRSLVWYDTLTESIKKVNELFPNRKPIKVEMRFDNGSFDGVENKLKEGDENVEL